MLQSKKYNKKVTSAEDLAKIMKAILSSEDRNDQLKEHFWTIGLNSRNRILFIDLSSLGTMTEAVVSPRDIFRLAILKECIVVLFVHNHPGGVSDPSSQDRAITDKLVKAGAILDIKVLDHLIINNEDDVYYSFSDEGLI